MDKPFTATGPTTLVVNAALQITSGQPAGQVYRVRNVAAVVQYLTWGPSASVASLTPAAGVPAPNTIGFAASAVEKITIPINNPYFVASSATGFEITLGDGF